MLKSSIIQKIFTECCIFSLLNFPTFSLPYKSGKMQTWYNAFKCFPVNQFFEKWVSFRERSIKLLLESVTCIAVTETLTCILQQKQLCPAESTTWIIAIETPSCLNTKKIVTHIFDAKTVTCINAAETSYWVIATETATCMIGTETSTNITVTESTTCIVARQPQNLHNCNRCCHLHNCYRECQLHSSNRNCHLQNWLYTETFTCRNGASQRFF